MALKLVFKRALEVKIGGVLRVIIINHYKIQEYMIKNKVLKRIFKVPKIEARVEKNHRK